MMTLPCTEAGWKPQRGLENLPQGRISHDREPAPVVGALPVDHTCKIAPEAHRQAQVLVLLADRNLELPFAIGRGDLLPEGREHRVRGAEVEAEGAGEVEVALVRQPVGQRVVGQRPVGQHLLDKELRSDVGVQPERPQRDLKQPPVAHEVFGGLHIADLLLEVRRLALHLRRAIEGRLLGGLRALKEAPAGVARQWNDRREHQPRPAASNRSSRGRSARSDFSA
jgi:hypothetical protein